MKEFIAKSDRQLGLCLKMLFAEQIEFDVRLELNEKGKVVYYVSAAADDKTLDELNLKYESLIK